MENALEVRLSNRTEQEGLKWRANIFQNFRLDFLKNFETKRGIFCDSPGSQYFTRVTRDSISATTAIATVTATTITATTISATAIASSAAA